MENSTKAIMIGVALFITIGLISAVLIISSLGTDMMSSSNKQLEGVSASISAQLLADYDVREMTGASVIASIKKFYDKPNFLLCVDTGINASYIQSFYSTKQITGSVILKPSYDGNNIAGDFNNTYRNNYICFVFNGSIADNTPTITGLSSKIKSTDKYMSYIIYKVGTDTMLGVYFKKIS